MTPRRVTRGEAQLWAEERGFVYFDTSAATGMASGVRQQLNGSKTHSHTQFLLETTVIVTQKHRPLLLPSLPSLSLLSCFFSFDSFCLFSLSSLSSLASLPSPTFLLFHFPLFTSSVSFCSSHSVLLHPSVTGDGVAEAFDWLFRRAIAQAYLGENPLTAAAPSFTQADLDVVTRCEQSAM